MDAYRNLKQKIKKDGRNVVTANDIILELRDHLTEGDIEIIYKFYGIGMVELTKKNMVRNGWNW